MRTRHLCCAIALGTLALVGVAAGDTARGGWLPPTVGLAPAGGFDVHVAMAADGGAVAVWDGPTGVQAVTRPAGGSWSAPAALGNLFEPHLALDGRGDAIVPAVQSDDGTARVIAFAKSADSEWTGPVRVSAAETDIGFGTDLAANDGAEAVTAWTAPDQGLWVARAALRQADGMWSPPQNLGYADFTAPYTAIDARGDAVVLWTRGSGTTQVYAELRPAGGDWQPAVVLSGSGFGNTKAALAMNRRGDALAVWPEADGPTRVRFVSSFRAAAGGDWTAPSRLPFSPTLALTFDPPSIALDDQGNATVVAQTVDGHVEVATRAFGDATWAGPTAIGDSGSDDPALQDTWCVDPRVALDAAGRAVVIWGGAALHAARREGGWQQPVEVADAPACFARSLAVDPAGDTVAIWNASANAVTRLDASILDATPPAIGRLVVPGTARPGRRVRFSVAATDALSSLAQPPLWRFGDGATARGLAVRHAYRRPGRYRVTVTVTDLARNQATATAAILVRKRR
jgi:PKD domain